MERNITGNTFSYDKQEKAIQTVIEQAKLLAEELV